MKRVLIITYYWPSSGGGGVQRWLKFAKYLPMHNWKPFVAAPENPEYPVIDASLLKEIPKEVEIIKLPIWEPYDVFKKLTGRKKDVKVNTGILFDDRKRSLLVKISLWIRGNILIPDPRVFWVKPSIKRLKKQIKIINPDAIITTGPPHSVHLIGLGLKKYFPKIKWIVDFRDPWSEIDYLDNFYVTSLARKWQRKLEKRVLDYSDLILTVSPTWARDIQLNTKTPVECITNGYDEDDFFDLKNTINSDKFIISHVGMINSFRNPYDLWAAIEELCTELPEFSQKLKIQLIGISDSGLGKGFDKYPNVKAKTVVLAYIPHDEVIQIYYQSSCLLLLLNNTKNSKGHIPGKFFEYLAAQRPILAIGPMDSDVKNIIEDCSAGFVCEFENKQKIKEALSKIYLKIKNQEYQTNSQQIKLMSREVLAKKLVNLLDKMQE